MLDLHQVEEFLKLHKDALGLVLSAGSTLSAFIAAISLLVAALTYFGNRRSRDFGAVTAIQKMVREEANLLYTAANPYDEAKYAWFASNYFDVLEVAAFSINEKLLDSKSRGFESKWLVGEADKLFSHPGVTGELFHKARAKGAYPELDRFYRRHYGPYIEQPKPPNTIP
ncbi:hypothetical protein G6M14_25720 [Agrobacterium tumefaciens]|uniref:hypothetical protein n=1 Tax=Agrobacterium tumefaciens complex TaxID=1183400 RepID=UPI0015731C72|nr:hypothetical protein [Agrobacterium fabrum]NSZ09773.1 hypothetical protein [Agrobacterium tumefaciens]